jgi:hypothetical protein
VARCSDNMVRNNLVQTQPVNALIEDIFGKSDDDEQSWQAQLVVGHCFLRANDWKHLWVAYR